ncbi:chorismate lyase [Pseudogulbenkiania sp. MAI-1]|uniref:chorismate--pyruvate lyase family protein n=1 Tax=Pseudogulbenkiania sp. MAI-1 TaxID=990370 RepID=UPI001E3F0BD7|nr:chorismate lyase [Pseudogulbenkiania sp. MAI-1]
MLLDTRWAATPPSLPPALLDCLTEPGSLTERLMSYGHDFAVTVLEQGDSRVHDDEAALLGLPVGAPLYARHVALTLDDTPVVVARSVTRLGCPAWHPILQRGSRSLGFTLFGGHAGIVREPLAYRELDATHPLFALAHAHDPASAHSYPARRSRFLLVNTPLIVCEVFLPALERFLP